ncbi:MAG: hypothetical protein U9Q03_00900 [Patescibacteria group bacterium]|nr:hypothetical protein [Patescibacteria group bacterium]
MRRHLTVGALGLIYFAITLLFMCSMSGCASAVQVEPETPPPQEDESLEDMVRSLEETQRSLEEMGDTVGGLLDAVGPTTVMPPEEPRLPRALRLPQGWSVNRLDDDYFGIRSEDDGSARMSVYSDGSYGWGVIYYVGSGEHEQMCLAGEMTVDPEGEVPGNFETDLDESGATPVIRMNWPVSESVLREFEDILEHRRGGRCISMRGSR